MARKVQQRKVKKAIYVFWEGESEEAYSKSLKRMFAGQAVIKPHREKGTFDTARTFYRGNRAFQNDLPEYACLSELHIQMPHPVRKSL